MKVGLFLVVIFLQGCFSTPVIKADDICQVLDEKVRWYLALKKSSKKWDVDTSLILAFIHQESRFKSDALPPKDTFFDLFRSSSAYGFAQVKYNTWEWYKLKTGNDSANRDNFDDVTDFIGWYVNKTKSILAIDNNDVKNQYLAYHEGHGGYKKKTYLNKKWLVRVSDKVKKRANLYKRHLNKCDAELSKNRPWSIF